MPARRDLLIAAIALALLPVALNAIGLGTTSATEVVIFAMACMALNILVGYTGLTSFGHGAWFGLGAYAAGMLQRDLFKDSFLLPVAFGLAIVIAAAWVFGFLILRRRGVYFSLLTLALSAMLYSVAFRWTAFTGGENGLGGVTRAVWFGADLANLVNEAALNDARQNRKLVMMIDFELAKDKILMGAERKSMILSDAEKRTTAYHEAGHAIVAVIVPNADPLHKVSIIPRGMALGVTMQLPVDDKHNYSKVYCEDQLCILMGGRIAEEIYLNQMTTGAGNDIERATEMARKMVCEWGMSELGPLSFGKKEEQIFLGREISQHRDYSEETAIRIDEEVKRIISTAYSRARAVIDQHSNALVKVAEALLEREVLDGGEVRTIMEGGNLPPMSGSKPKDSADHTQQVIRPESGSGRRLPGLSEGEQPSPA